MIRTFVERVSRRLVFRRHLPREYGDRDFYVSPEGGLRYFRPDILQVDRVLLESARRIVSSGDVVWDVGANVGLFCFAASGLAGTNGRIFAIEPDTFLVSMLRRSAALDSQSAPVKVLPVAVAESVRLADFCVAARARSCNHLQGHGTTQTGGVREEQTVMAVSLDWLATKIPPPQVLKIDTEGAEVAVLNGAREVLSRHRPKLLCEVADENADQVSATLEECGYQMFDAERPEDRVQRATWNTLALPVTSSRREVVTY